MADPRLYQIGVLSALLVYGMAWLDFEITAGRAVLLLGTVLATQALCDRLDGPRPANLKSALISGLSLCLLLRTNSPGLAVLAGVIAIAGKFLFRIRRKHLFNPTNGAVVALLLFTDQAWVSPGQWGSVAFFGFLMACLGGLVVNRASRSDVTYAFIASYCALMFGRSLYLGEPIAIPLHRLESGGLLLFTFFMISDPKTTPDSRAGRVLFAALVAFSAWYVQFRLFKTNGLLWSLAAWSLAVPLIDRLLPGDRYSWGTPSRSRAAELGRRAYELVPTAMTGISKGSLAMKRIVTGIGIMSLLAWWAPALAGFCGFYVGKADTKIFNQASQVVLVRDGDRTVLTMVNDFQGSMKEFALVVPVPTFLKRDQIHVGDKALVDHLDAYSAPRLVEYFDEDPCRRVVYERAMPMAAAPSPIQDARGESRRRSLGVTIEASYTVGEYDILILSARQSTGLETWLRENGYRIPAGASEILASYLKQNMRFFVAKVNVTEQSKLGFAYLRPLQVAFESPKFMLPLRLGTVNANGPQDLIVYALTRKGRVETTNYRTVKLPSDMDLPVFLKDRGEFSRFYKAMFTRQVEKHDGRVVFTEYAWDMGWCDPCASDPLSNDELRNLGVFWQDGAGSRPAQVYLTRLHVRYDGAHFPEDLVFQETGDRANFQGRYVMRHAWTGVATCDAGQTYRLSVRQRQEQEAQQLASLTGWPIGGIRAKMGLGDKPLVEPAWWQRIWKN